MSTETQPEPIGRVVDRFIASSERIQARLILELKAESKKLREELHAQREINIDLRDSISAESDSPAQSIEMALARRRRVTELETEVVDLHSKILSLEVK